jgi:hypothetical protein
VNQGFWTLRHHICETCTFHDFGTFRGDTGGGCGAEAACTCNSNAANPPWTWRDHTGVGPGDWLSDPALLFDLDFDGPPFDPGVFSHAYTSHPYYTHQVDLVGARQLSAAARSIVVDVFTQSASGSSQVIGEAHWRKNAALPSTWWPWGYGYYDATLDAEYSQNLGSYRFTRQVSDRDGANVGDSVTVRLRDPAGSTLMTRTITPGDWSSGSCGASDDTDCVSSGGSIQYCRTQVNDFRCGNGAATTLGGVRFRMTRHRPASSYFSPVIKTKLF